MASSTHSLTHCVQPFRLQSHRPQTRMLASHAIHQNLIPSIKRNQTFSAAPPTTKPDTTSYKTIHTYPYNRFIDWKIPPVTDLDPWRIICDASPHPVSLPSRAHRRVSSLRSLVSVLITLRLFRASRPSFGTRFQPCRAPRAPMSTLMLMPTVAMAAPLGGSTF